MPWGCGLAPGHPLRLLPLALSGPPSCRANPITSARRERSSNPGPRSSLLARRLSSRSRLLSCCLAIRLAFLACLSTPPPVLRPITYPHGLATSPRALDTYSSAPPGAPSPARLSCPDLARHRRRPGLWSLLDGRLQPVPPPALCLETAPPFLRLSFDASA